MHNLIKDYRLCGFDRPVFLRDGDKFVLDIWDICGQWKSVRGSSKETCLHLAIEWYKSQRSWVNTERLQIVNRYPGARKKTKEHFTSWRRHKDKRRTRVVSSSTRVVSSSTK